jgi:hypothetical protein
MWTHEASIETAVPPHVVWRLFADVGGWTRWNAGIERIAPHGPFARGSTFTLHPPGGEPLTSTFVEVAENVCFTDETLVDGNRVAVAHLLEPRAGGTRVVYRTQVDGPDDTAIGPRVSGDFGAVLAALKDLAEREILVAAA